MYDRESKLVEAPCDCNRRMVVKAKFWGDYIFEGYLPEILNVLSSAKKAESHYTSGEGYKYTLQDSDITLEVLPFRSLVLAEDDKLKLATTKLEDTQKSYEAERNARWKLDAKVKELEAKLCKMMQRFGEEPEPEEEKDA